MTNPPKNKAYAEAGVDIELGNRVKQGLQDKVRTTFGPEVLGKIGGFGGLFRAHFQNMHEPVLVSSIDGVGTKLKIAISLGKHESVAQDLVNHCINDIAVTGARPLFFLDYIGAERLEPAVFNQLRRAGINVQETENVVFEGAAAVARVHLDSAPPPGALDAMRAESPDIIELSVLRL